jgi:hypothetical protein
MSIITYRQSQEIMDGDWEFYALIMAAMRKADNDNERKLRAVFPGIWEELKDRYNAPGGALTENERKWVDQMEDPSAVEEKDWMEL